MKGFKQWDDKIWYVCWRAHSRESITGAIPEVDGLFERLFYNPAEMSILTNIEVEMIERNPKKKCSKHNP